MIYALIVLALLGLITWAVTTLVPMPPPLRTVIVVFVVIVAILFVLRVLGFGGVIVDPAPPVIVR